MKALLSAVLLAPLFLTGCNTIAGAGEDISAAGRAIKKTAETVEGQINEPGQNNKDELVGGPREK